MAITQIDVFSFETHRPVSFSVKSPDETATITTTTTAELISTTQVSVSLESKSDLSC